MTKKIIIKKENNKGIFLLQVLSIFRDKDILTSLQEFPRYTKSYDEDGQIMIQSASDNMIKVIKELNEVGVKYDLYEE